MWFVATGALPRYARFASLAPLAIGFASVAFGAGGSVSTIVGTSVASSLATLAFVTP